MLNTLDWKCFLPFHCENSLNKALKDDFHPLPKVRVDGQCDNLKRLSLS